MMKWSSTQVPVAGLESGVAGVCAASHEDRPRWFFATLDGRVRGIDLDDGSIFFDVQLSFTFEKRNAASLVASRDGRFLAIVQDFGLQGAVFDVQQQRLISALNRDDYHANVSGWALALVRYGEREVLITATAWNRLEAFSLPEFERLAPSTDESTLDYFWGSAVASPSGRRLASFGWFWHPVGAVRVVEVDAWLETRVDPPPVKFEPVMADWWDGTICWLDERRIAMSGQRPNPTPSEDDDGFFTNADGVLIIDLETKTVERYFDALHPRLLVTDGPRLISLGAQTHAVSLADGAVLPLGAGTDAWHPGTRTLFTVPQLREEVGPCVVHRLTGTLGSRAELPLKPTAESLLVLADALDEAGGPSEAIAHCRAPGPHGRTCWVIEALR